VGLSTFEWDMLSFFIYTCISALGFTYMSQMFCLEVLSPVPFKLVFSHC
jgi:hypothetical protein